MENLTNYSKEQLGQFRKSIQNMGTSVNNGTIEIPLGDTMPKGRRIMERLKPEDVSR